MLSKVTLTSRSRFRKRSKSSLISKLYCYPFLFTHCTLFRHNFDNDTCNTALTHAVATSCCKIKALHSENPALPSFPPPPPSPGCRTASLLLTHSNRKLHNGRGCDPHLLILSLHRNSLQCVIKRIMQDRLQQDSADGGDCCPLG